MIEAEIQVMADMYGRVIKVYTLDPFEFHEFRSKNKIINSEIICIL